MSTPQSPDPEQRFTALFDGTYGDVLRFVCRRHGDECAEDVVAEAFLVAWRRLEDLPEDPGDARAWLFGIARGTLANSRRGDRRRDALGVRLAEHGAHAGQGNHDAATLRLDVGRSWAHLTGSEQEAIALAVLDGLTSAQAARVLGITPVAYRLRLSRARRRLRRLVEDGPPPSPRTAADRTARLADTAWEATS
ncbi:RNA polymerase sigma factor [Brachybacterium paraconglomeratum]|uniref:RNA polymerase sigma factor n=1 Tax=Brachybacterium paraconglomeratum TaxID=173362 RepID=UPI0022E423D7|nr:sigma-70 family RNA polymerase sigma factor [Brachybacterium paraconglomeratum]